jgi:tRNA threonylcarbamoyl adenosine modification protein YeaZ
MKILSFDTSNNLASVAVLADQQLLAYSTSLENSQQAEKLFSLIAECLEKAKLKLTELDLISVTNGPGSFTGVRIGLAAALGMQMVVKIPIISLSNFQVMAWQIREQYPNQNLAIVLDARRDQVYHQLFDHNLDVLTDPSLMARGNIPRTDAVICENGVPNAEILARSSEYFYHKKQFSNLDPLYIREPDASIPANV